MYKTRMALRTKLSCEEIFEWNIYYTCQGNCFALLLHFENFTIRKAITPSTAETEKEKTFTDICMYVVEQYKKYLRFI